MARVEQIATRIGFEPEDCASSSGFLYQLLVIFFAVPDYQMVRYTNRLVDIFENSTVVADIEPEHFSHNKQLNEIVNG